MKRIKNILKIISILCISLSVLPIAYAEEIKVGIETEKSYTTFRMQSIMGKWTLRLKKETATGTYYITEEIRTDEHAVVMIVPKGIIVNISPNTVLDEGYKSINISGGELLSLELPKSFPKLIQGSLDVINDDGRLDIVNKIPIDKYTISCASSEIISCEPEAVKAQIVAIETKIHYLKHNSKHPKDNYDVCDSDHCIKFLGAAYNRELVELLYPTIHNHLLYYKNKLIYPRYHHTCGGRISSAEDVYGVKDEPYHKAHNDLHNNKGSENCFHSPSFHWTVEIQISSIPDFLSLEFAGGADNIFINWVPIKVNEEGRVLMMRIIGRKVKEIQGIEFLEHLHNFYGINSIKSMRFTYEPLRRSMLIRGMGEGDGVGMCLYGADGLAKKGLNYKEILEFYYPGTTLK